MSDYLNKRSLSLPVTLNVNAPFPAYNFAL